jgi:D-arginine dehydrogenase
MKHFDVVIVGAGMAGASLAAELAPYASVLLLEMEAQPGYHATGRSVAFWSESYGGPGVQPLTTASGPLLRNPDPEFSDRTFLNSRGAIHVGRAEDANALDKFAQEYAPLGIELKSLDRRELERRVAGLGPDWLHGIGEPSTADIDVAALHAAYLGAAKRAGAELESGRKLISAQRAQSGWQLQTSGGTIMATILVNASGAWADLVARACGVGPAGIRPLQRTVVQLRTSPAPPQNMPLIMDISGRFYFKVEGSGRLWLSPHDEAPVEAGDVAPEEIAVAEAIARFEQVVDWKIEAVERKWAGLRSFAPDRLPVYGFDPLATGFFWFAGQGGFGIQTSPAAAKLGASLLLQTRPDPAVANIDPAPYDPGRFE